MNSCILRELFLLTTVWSTIAIDVASTIESLRSSYVWPSGIEAIGGPPPKSQTCAVSKLAYDYALELQPQNAPLLSLWDALELTTECALPRPAAPSQPLPPPSFPLPKVNALYVDYTKGSDASAGSTPAAPLKTIRRALSLIEQLKPTMTTTIVLRAGTHFLSETLDITAAHSRLVLMNYPGEETWISGGVAISPQWRKGAGPMAKHLGPNAPMDQVYHAVLDDALLTEVLGLNLHVEHDPIHNNALHAKWVRARAPNKNSAHDGTQWHQHFGSGEWLKPTDWGPSLPAAKRADTLWLDAPASAFNRTGSHFTYGVGGEACTRYSPSGGFWCSANSSGGGSGWELMVPGAPLFPTGVKVNASAELASAGVPSPENWSDKSGAVIETWTNGWSTTFWTVGDIISSGVNQTFVFSGGGQQSGRGFHVDPPNPTPWKRPMEAGAWKIENAIELLDAPEEWFFDEKTRSLYIIVNGTSSTSNGLPPQTFVVPKLKTLLSITGKTQATAVRDISIKGIGFRDSAYTYLDAWGIPSGGDWALHRGGAVFVENVSGFVVSQSKFTLLDGNAVFLSGYVRGAELLNSTFAYIGDNAMAAWGYTGAGTMTPSSAHLPQGTGYDGTTGDQPRGTKIFGNIVREIGLNERQSSAWSEAKACSSHVKGNLFFNLPRAAINKNDGFGGGTLIEQNLLSNTCRESGDHGPFNSWDRQPFMTTVGDGKTPSLVPAYNTITNNFFISNYGAGFGVDNDDTSSYYNITSNFFYLGGGVKCDYDGHEKRFSHNLMLGTTAGCWHTCSYKKGFPDHCHDNTFVQANVSRTAEGDSTPPFAIIWFCDAKNVSHILPDYANEVQMGDFIYGNTILNVAGKATVTCGYSGLSNVTTVPLSAFTDVGLMRGTTVGKAPTDAAVLDMARSLLGMKVRKEVNLVAL